MRRGPWLWKGIAGIAIIAGSFFGTLWTLRGPEIPRPITLENTSISDEASLKAAARAAGFQVDLERIKGNIDSLKRLSPSQVTISGWVVDLEGNGDPIKLFGFSENKGIFQVQTDGGRQDVAESFMMPADLPVMKNVSFTATTSCRAGAKVFIAAFGRKNRYLALPPATCP